MNISLSLRASVLVFAICVGGTPLSAQVSETEEQSLRLPFSGEMLHLNKVIDPASREVVRSATNAHGDAVNLEEVIRREIRQRNAVAGAKLHWDLKAALSERPATELLPLVVWLTCDQAHLDSLVWEEIRDLSGGAAEAEARAEALVRAHLEGILNEGRMALESMGLVVAQPTSDGPVLLTQGTAAQIALLEHKACIDRLYLDEGEVGFLNNQSNATHRTSRVHEYGAKGRGAGVAVFGEMAQHNFLRLPVVEFLQPNATPTSHATQVAGVMASRRSTHLGAAPASDLYCANASIVGTSGILSASSWVNARPIDVINLSYFAGATTQPVFQDRWFDFQVRNFMDSYVAAAGNLGLTSGNVTTPAKAWNVLTVGSFDHGGNGDWTGDTMSDFSSYVNPSTGVQKPNMVAAGEGIVTADLTALGGTSPPVSGTSYAAPAVTGALANVIGAVPFLSAYPETCMAIMMATAWHNITSTTTNSNQDGAGGLHGLAAYRVAVDDRWQSFNLTPANFTPLGYFNRTIMAHKGERVRVCIAWMARADGLGQMSSLQADFDLTILSGSNQILGQSLSFSNNYEMVEFTAPETGVYNVRIDDTSFTSSSERIGMAYSRRYVDTSFGTLRENTVEAAPTAGATIGNANYGLDLDLPGSPNLPFVAIPCARIPFSPMSGTAVSPLTWYPTTWDAVTQLWLDDLQSTAFDIWTGSVGQLDSAGRNNQHSLNIVNDPGLVGLTLYHVGATFETGYPDNIKEFSEVNEMRVWPAGVDKTRTDNGFFVQPLPFGFKFYDLVYNQCYISMNGRISFGTSAGGSIPNAADFLSQAPSIAFLWADLAPHLPGMEGIPVVRTREIFTGNLSTQEVIIEFLNVPVQGAQLPISSNSVRIRLTGRSEIIIEYRDINMAGSPCLVGVSPGFNQTTGSEIDLSESGNFRPFGSNAIFEYFTGGCPGTLCINPDFFDLEGDGTHWTRLKFTLDDSMAFATYRASMDLR